MHLLVVLRLLATVAAGLGLGGAASQQLAQEAGCYSCHGEPPRRGAPGMA
jgi:cytochrome c551/c552